MKSKLAHGYSMVEVMVAIFLLSVGVLGAVGIQIAATRTTQQSAYQTMALQLAADIADTVRAYTTEEAHAQAFGTMLELDHVSTPGAPAASQITCYFNQCGLSEFANAEIGEWKMRLATSFPAARLRICRDASPWNAEGQAYKWDCNGEGGNAPLVIKIGWQAKITDGSPVKNSESSFPPIVVLPAAAI